MLRSKTHLCWASRTSPCHASSARCVRAPWTTLWRWSCRGDSLRKTSCRFFLRTPVPVLWGPVAWTRGAAGYPQEYEARQVHAEKRQGDKKVGYKRGMGGRERWGQGRCTVLSGWMNLKQCHSWPVSFIYSMRPVISVPFSSPQRKEHSHTSSSCTEQPQVDSDQTRVKSQVLFFESESSLESCSKRHKSRPSRDAQYISTK